MIERAIADGAGWAGAGRQRVWRQLRFRRRVRCEGWLRRRLHRTTRVAPGLLGRRIGDPVAVGDLADAIGRGGFRRVTWREGTKGKMSSRFATERVVLAQRRPRSSQREAVWLLMEWPHGERQRRTLPRPRAGEHVTAPARSESQQRWRTERVTRRQGRAWAGSLRGPLFRGWNHHVSMVLVCFAFIVAERSRAFPPRPEKLPRGSVARTTGADGTRRSGTSGFLHPVRLAVARVLATWFPDAPCVTDRVDGTAW